ncbi:MAG: gamma-glutamyltransferase, partial [Calditrichia bacterium]|nr:gamma-glutamyltransferase [Calditrichia bacterium]
MLKNLLILLIIISFFSCEKSSELKSYTGNTAKHGMVVAEEKLAAQIGRDILKSGGNAFDAATAVGFALAVTHPEAGNLGGGGYMVAHLANGENIALDFRETAPEKSFRD